MTRDSFAALKAIDMNLTTFLSSTLCFAFAATLNAQYAAPDPSGLEGIIVEKYYVADANDAADVDGGTNLPAGSTTYRVFVDMLEGYKLLTVAGYVDHDLSFNTTTSFFYNEDRGDSWGRLINDIHLNKNTVAIDSWLTMGAASDAHWGVPKAEDTDGSIVGGANNDGGSNAVEGGLLLNFTPEMGLPLTQSDGLFLDATAPPSAVNVGEAPTIFNEPNGSSYVTQDWGWGVLGGMQSPIAGNKVLIGQFTTDGVFSFCLNVWIKLPDELVCGSLDCHQNLEFYGNLLESDTAILGPLGDNRFTHPTLCYNSSAGVVDCLGTPGGPALPGTACNDGNPDTGNDIYSATCECLGEDCLGVAGGDALPGTPCDDGNPDTGDDIWAPGCTCSGITGINGPSALDALFSVYPNPTNDVLWMELSDLAGQMVKYDLMDAQGRRIMGHDLGRLSGQWKGSLDLSDLSAGIYFLEVTLNGLGHTERITKH